DLSDMDMQSTEDCSNLPPQGFVLPQFIPLTPESVRLSLQRYQRQKRREQKAKELQKEQRRRREEWKKNKADYQSDKSETENATFGHPALNPLEDGLMNSVSEEEDEEDASEVPSRANPLLATGKKLIPPLSNKFCAKRYTGKPLQEMDDFYRVTFTVFYTCEAIIRVVGCGLIRNEFAYLRDAWNWLDFIVITLAYIMFVVPSLGNLSALRSLRVLRALKTVTAVPGLKTIIGALTDAVMHLRDVAVLTLFMLSIFALIGVQLYRGTLLRKCVVPWPGFNSTVGGALLSQIATDVYNNKSFDPYLTTEIKDTFNGTFSNFVSKMNDSTVGNIVLNDDMVSRVWLALSNYSRDGNSTCPVDFICKQTRTGNPNFGYTNFDNFASAFLCSFRLITQDYWESLYQLVLRANGPTHVFFFGMVIFLGSFYLLNIILAIVSMSYEQVCKQDMESDAQLAAAIELCAEDEAEQNKESVDSKKDLPMMNCNGFHFTSTSRRHSIATTDICTQLTLPRRWKSDDVLFNHRRVDSTRIWDNAVLFADEFSMGSASCVKDLSSLTSNSRKDCVSLVSAELSTVSGASGLSGQFSPNGFSNNNPNALAMEDLGDGRLPFNASQFALPLEEKCVNRNHTNYTASRLKCCTKHKSDLSSHINSRKSGKNLKKRLCSCLFDQRRELPEHPACCKELSLSARICQKISKQIELVLCGWTCCPCYYVFQRYVGYIILDPFVELFITICIVLNTLFMAIDQPEKGETLAAVLRIANYASLWDSAL
ncbi:Sodium channel protein type 10 subunit alpha, partial [Taenia solium]